MRGLPRFRCTEIIYLSKYYTLNHSVANKCMCAGACWCDVLLI